MSGKKGRSGGYRPPRKPPLNVLSTADPLAFLLSVVACPEASSEQRIRAAVATLPFVHLAQRRRGKKDRKQEAADQAARDLPTWRTPALAVVKKAK